MDKRTTKGHFTRIRNIEAYKETSYTPPRQAALRITESYYNYTGKVLYLAHRNNILFPLAMEDRHMNMPQQHVGKLVIEQQFLVAYDRVDEFINQLMLDVEEDTENHNIEQHRVIEAITGGDHIEKHRSGLQFTVRYVIGGKAIQTQPNGLYITNLDVAIGFEGTDVIHPYAARTAASIYNQYQKNQKEAPRSNFTVMLVDNAGRYNSLYINIHGDAMEIKPTRSENIFYKHISSKNRFDNNHTHARVQYIRPPPPICGLRPPTPSCPSINHFQDLNFPLFNFTSF